MSVNKRLDELHALANASSNEVAARIEAMARSSYLRLLELIREGKLDPRDAVAAVMADFDPAYKQALALAFGRLLQRHVMVGAVGAMPVGDVVLSERLHRHARETAAEVTAIVRQHAQGVAQARELSRQLYDGYSPAGGIRRPLEGAARAQLPKALRELTMHPGARVELDRIYRRAQQQAARVKSSELRAAYDELLKAWEKGAGAAALADKLDHAYRRKTRQMADRIAQTELARAYQAGVAAELMADPEQHPVEVRMNPAHPRRDICDLHARGNFFGLGPGIYPKAKAPRPPFHSYCWCRIRSRQDLESAGAQERPGGAAEYLASMPPADAARVMGSAERAQRIRSGETVDSVVNEGKHPAYQLRRVGDPAAWQHHMTGG